MLGEPARQRALAARRRPVDGDDERVRRFGAHAASAPSANSAPRPRSSSTKLGKEVRDRLAVVDGDRALGREAHDEKAHGDAVVEMRRHRAAAPHAPALDDEARLRPRGRRRRSPRARAPPRRGGRIPSPAAPPAPASPCAPRRRRRRRRAPDIRRSSRARARPARRRPSAARRARARRRSSRRRRAARSRSRGRRPSPSAWRSGRCGRD